MLMLTSTLAEFDAW